MKCLMRVFINTNISCRCISRIDMPFPEPDQVLVEESGNDKSRILSELNDGQ